MPPDPDTIKHREIGFSDPHPDPRQAHHAVLLLAGIDGVVDVSLDQDSANTIHVTYDLRRVCLCVIETLLTELGFHLDNSLIAKLKRALYYYSEENERDNRDSVRDQDHSVRDIFMRCYRCKTHGCRDERPDYWRRYL
jgi:hypothetical protein